MTQDKTLPRKFTRLRKFKIWNLIFIIKNRRFQLIEKRNIIYVSENT